MELENGFTQEEKKGFIKNALGLMEVAKEDAIKALQDTYGEIKGAKAYQILTKGKLLGADFIMSYDDKKSAGENVANYAGSFIQVAVTAGTLAVAGYAGFFGATLAIGITYGLKKVGFELGSYTEDLYKYFDDTLSNITNSQQSKHEAWENLTKEEQAKWIDSGGLPWNYDPNSKSLTELYGQIDTSIIDEIKEQINIASQIRSPIILDLNGDGVVETTSKGSVYFDHDANGFAEQTGWVGADDGLLIYDRNNNGKIDDGTELFGNNTLLSNGNKATNGFEALKEFDTNKDGVIDKSDEIYSQLKVWQDANQNGVVDEGELKTLEELGIESLNTSYVNSSLVDENNNAHKQLGSFTKDGQTYKMNDVWFDVDLARTKELNLVEASEEIQRLALVS